VLSAKSKVSGDIGTTVGKTAGSMLLMASLGVATSAHAIEFGRAHLASAAGQPLRITIPVRDLTPQDIQTLAATVAAAQQWQQAGLTPPVDISKLQVRVIDGPQPNTRLLEVRSTEVPQGAVIDILLDVSSASTKRLLQSSVIRPAPVQVNLAGMTHQVLRGDTLFGIAQQFPVEGATLYQMLWALFSANPQAFFNNNMNLLKAGSSLRIPSPQDVLAVDPRYAHQQYLSHVNAFRAMRGRPGATLHPASSTAMSKADDGTSNKGSVEAPSAEVVKDQANDQVRLSNPGTSGASAAEDQKTSMQHALDEEKKRVEILEKNIASLKGALAVAGSGAHDKPNNTGAASDTSGQVQAGDTGSGAGNTPGAGTGAGNTSETGTGQANGQQSGQASGSAANGQGGEASAPTGQPGQAQSDAQSQQGQGDGTSSQSSQGQGSESSSGALQSATFHSGQGGSQKQQGEPTQISSDSAVDQVKQWVSDNVLAAGALILALIALVFAWIMRSSAQRESSGRAQNPQAKAFEEKLKQIDLDLKSEPAVQDAAQKVEPKIEAVAAAAATVAAAADAVAANQDTKSEEAGKEQNVQQDQAETAEDKGDAQQSKAEGKKDQADSGKGRKNGKKGSGKSR